MLVEIFTDGCSKGNPGPGGFGAILRYGAHVKELSEGYRHTTNNRMELLGVIRALESLKGGGKYQVTITTDSKYVVDSVEKGWVFGWVKHYNFKGMKNKDLWLQFLLLYDLHDITFKWVKGHNGHKENERCDQLANYAIQSNECLYIDEEYEKTNLLNQTQLK